MKKLAVLFVFTFILSVNSFALTSEEKNTVHKLEDMGVVAELRTIEQLHAPMRTIDVLSTAIKSLRVANKMDSDRWLDMNQQFSDAFLSLYEWQDQIESELDTYKDQEAEIEKLKQQQESLGFFMILGAIFMVVTAL